jgi:sulfatase maturation enzyme AslB (radical SAM superfamily)
LDHLLTRNPRLAALLSKIGAQDDVRVPHLLECLYVMPSTVCNLKCRFCAYPKTSIAKRFMPQELFAEVIDKACAYGFTTFGLTPLLGEALIDPRFLDKLELLERHPEVTSYSFCTNFTVADPRFLDRLTQLEKLQWMSVSLYGHDEESFTRVTAAPPRLFLDVLRNLERLCDWPAIASHVELRIRTAGPFEPGQCHPRLRDLLDELTAKGVRVRIPVDRFSNWGGLISTADVAGLDIQLKPQPVKGGSPCAFLFYKHTVLPDGRLNACYADDGNATMVIGDLSRQSFEEIYSLRNDAYVELLLSHFEQRWSPTCRACTGYRSVRDQHYSYAFHRRPFLSMSEFLDTLA